MNRHKKYCQQKRQRSQQGTGIRKYFFSYGYFRQDSCFICRFICKQVFDRKDNPSNQKPEDCHTQYRSISTEYSRSGYCKRRKSSGCHYRKDWIHITGQSSQTGRHSNPRHLC